MRDLFITMIVFGSIPFIFMRPYVGILMWSWIGYMNPHRLGWGFAYNFPFAQVIAIVAIASYIMSKDKEFVPLRSTIIVWLMFIGWMMITTYFAVNPADAGPQLIKVIKIQLVVFLTLLMFSQMDRVHTLIWVIAGSIGFFAIKGGVFTILTGGAYHVWGPPGSFFYGNNELALASLITLPLFNYLRETSENKWVKRALLVSMILIVASVAGSQSRGALVAGLALGGFTWLKSKHKFVGSIIAVFALISVFLFMPQSWHERMGTIQEYDQDASALGRINAWKMAASMSAERVTGGGFESFTPSSFAQWAPVASDVHDAHSIYFEILGEHGYIGLLLFLTLAILSFRNASWIIKHSKDNPDLKRHHSLARMIQLSMIAYASGGAFLGMAYFDLYYHLMAILYLARLDAEKILSELKKSKADSDVDKWSKFA